MVGNQPVPEGRLRCFELIRGIQNAKPASEIPPENPAEKPNPLAFSHLLLAEPGKPEGYFPIYSNQKTGGGVGGNLGLKMEHRGSQGWSLAVGASLAFGDWVLELRHKSLPINRLGRDFTLIYDILHKNYCII